MKNIIKNIGKNISIIFLVILIILSTLLVGTPLIESNAQIVYIALSFFSVVYFIETIIQKEKIINNAIDIFMCVLVFSTLIPLVFGTYASLTETVHIILKYFCILNVYIIAKNECRKEPKNIKIIINTIIVSIIILCIIGIDDINQNYLQKFKEVIHYVSVKNDEKRVMSLFAYPNTMAAVTGVGIYLCLGRFFKADKIKMKIMYAIVAIFFLFTMILTYSRLVYIVFAMTIVFYIAILCKKYKISRFLNKRNISLLIIMIFMCISYIVVGLQISDNLKIENNYQKILYTVESNKEYNFKFEVEATGNSQIEIIEKNSFFDEIKKETKKIEKGNYTVEIPICTTDNTEVIYIYVQNDASELNIKKAYINNEELILKYKLLPTVLVDKLKSISFSNKSAWERFVFIEDALKLVKDNWIFGLGGNAWRIMQTKVQTYMYYTKEVHCYPIQIFLENGIVGFIACIAIGIWLIVNLILKLREKDLNMHEISILFAIIFLISHSMLDFNLSFFYVLVIMALMIAILSSQKKEVKGFRGIVLNLILIVMSLVNLEVASAEKYYNENSQIIVVNAERTEQDIFEDYYKLLSFNKDVKQRTYKAMRNADNKDYAKMKKMLLNIMKTEKYDGTNISLSNISNYISLILDYDSITDEDFEIILTCLNNTKDFGVYHAQSVLSRWRNWSLISSRLQEMGYKEYSKILDEKLNEEINSNEKYILDYENGRYNKERVEEYKKIINDIRTKELM